MTAMTAMPVLAEMPPGFAEPGLGAQAVFRHALEALSRPGRVQPVGGLAGVPRGLSPAMAALLLTLLDGETTLWLSAALDTPMNRSWLGFHTGVQLLQQPDRAAFIAVHGEELDLPLWQRLHRGSDERPQDGATLMVAVESLQEGPRFTLRGPGIESSQALAVRGIERAVWTARAAESAHYPLGLELLLCCGEQLIGLPRSTHIASED